MVKSLKLIIEALLFSSDKPLSPKDIRDCLPDASPAEIRSALKVLRYEYEAMGRSFTLKEVAGGYQLRTHPQYAPYIRKMIQSSPSRLSRAALETLAIIAYKQPILRQEIEKYRGVDVGGILKTLLEKGLIRIMGRKDLPGKPLIYGTTKRFLEVFDLKDLNSLPKLKEIQSLGSDELESEAPLKEGGPEGLPSQRSLIHEIKEITQNGFFEAQNRDSEKGAGDAPGEGEEDDGGQASGSAPEDIKGRQTRESLPTKTGRMDPDQEPSGG
ncbi:MAG: SMC-Scp complex subunit ScpB [Deltaproteobacteria bacterium]|nr:SMC-Scp complex subunit ScpB [Deltaproteobacteria bacterium]MBW2016775.1 SMC-Scp complex subunit ScpB [Deltaproteobacteria bacterium]MBW2130780.1 SMC-Scp complex subunit ScpB [Deltaproteobacteria bacterium]MBW2304198.1 SMC-Scp complex subunit ScpB [Deltaproteobacteria bacterium]